MAKAQELLSQYEKLISDESDRCNYQKIKADVEQYNKESDITLSLSRENKTEDAIVISSVCLLLLIKHQCIYDSLKYNEKLARNINERDYEN